MPLDLSGFNVGEQKFEGLYNAAEHVRQQNLRDRVFALQQETKKAATSKFFADYLDPKDHLTGTNYDPQIVSGYQNILQQAETLASKGTPTSDILMSIGPSISKLNEYSTKAKLINDQIKNSVAKLKAYPGYNPEALEMEAKRSAFYDANGQMKDISQVDPSTDWVAEAAKEHPEAITTGKGLDDLVQKTPMADYSRNVTTSYAGKSRNVRYEAKHPFWEDIKRDANGNIMTDQAGNPLGLGVVGSNITDDQGKPIVNPENNQPYTGLDKNYFNAIMTHNPDVADYIRGEVNTHFKNAGAKQTPIEGSPQWDAMARHILQDELQSRSKSYFRTIDQQKESAQAIKIDIAQSPDMLKSVAEFNAAQRGTGDYAAYNPKAGKAIKTNAVEAVGKIFNNDPDFLQGEQEDVNGRNVINVTQYFPGGGLKSGRGSDETYKQIWYDPNKRSLLVSTQPRQADAKGNKPLSVEEIPENKAGFFMSRIAASNNVDPTKVSDILKQVGYNNAKFNSVQPYGQIQNRMDQEQSDKVNTALEKGDWGKLSGVPVKDGTITEISERKISSMLPGVDKYAVYVKGADGKVTKAFTTSDKSELEEYIKSGQQSTAPAQKKGILD